MNNYTLLAFTKYVEAKQLKFKQHQPHNTAIDYYLSSSTESKGLEELFIYTHGNLNDYNGKAKDKTGKEIWCRHLAYFWLCLQGKDWRDTLGAIASIQSQPSLHNNDFDKGYILLKADKYFDYNPSIGFGASLYAAIIGIQIGETKLMLFCSKNHAMALKVKYKPPTDQKPARIAVSFYNPNRTQSNVRVVGFNPEALQTLQLSSLLAKADIEKYLLNVNGGFFAIYDTPSYSRPTTIVPEFNIKLDKSRLSEQLYFALLINNQNLITEIMHEISSTDCADTVKIEILQAPLNGVNGLYLIMQDGFAGAITAYLDGLAKIALQIGLSLEQVYSLLEAKNARGISGLYMAVQNGNTEAITAYLDGLAKIALQIGLSLEQMYPLLAIRTNTGGSGLYSALQKGHTAAITAYVNGLLKVGVSPEHIYLIVGLIDDEVISGLHLALQSGYAQLVIGYFTALLNSEMPKVEIFNLLKIQNANGFSVLRILLDSRLSEHQKVELLLAEDGNGIPWLDSLLNDEDNSQDSELYLNEIINSSQLTNQLKMIFLLVKDAKGIPWLYRAVQANNITVVSIYINTILDSNLSQNTIVELLFAKDDNGKSLLENCLNQEILVPSIIMYLNLILNSHLKDKHKIKLLICKPIIVQSANSFIQEYLAIINDANFTEMVKLKQLERFFL